MIVLRSISNGAFSRTELAKGLHHGLAEESADKNLHAGEGLVVCAARREQSARAQLIALSGASSQLIVLSGGFLFFLFCFFLPASCWRLKLSWFSR
jgi:hypothetical protein